MSEREDPGLLAPLPVLTETVTVTDKRHPGKSWTFLLSIPCELSFSDLWFTQDRKDRWVSEYVDGGKYVDGGGGQFIPIESKLCEHIAMLFEAETMATGSSWTFPQWVVWQHKCPNAWADLCRKYYEMFVIARPMTDSESEGDSPPQEPTPKNASLVLAD